MEWITQWDQIIAAKPTLPGVWKRKNGGWLVRARTTSELTGKRVFKMAPIHHHYEQLGWTESQIVIRFWIVAVVLALAGLATLKLR